MVNHEERRCSFTRIRCLLIPAIPAFFNWIFLYPDTGAYAKMYKIRIKYYY
jgi:hypothetical protein